MTAGLTEASHRREVEKCARVIAGAGLLYWWRHTGTDMPGIRLAALVRKLRRDGPPDVGGSSDADLLARFAAARDEAAFELLVWRHGAMVLAACRRVLGHTEDAEDAFQAAFLVLARKAGGVRQSVPAWLHRVAVRIAARLARKRRPTALLEVEPAARPSPDAAERGELRGVLDAEIDRLSEPCRRAFVLCYLEGLSNADAARLIGCPVGTIESRLTAARRRLRDRLSRRKVELPTGILALLGAQSGLAKEAVAKLTRAAVLVAERGTGAAAGIVGEPAVKLAQGVLVMTKLRAFAGVALGVALLGLAAGVGWANRPADPPAVVPHVAAVEPEVAPQPKPKDGGAWPLARQVTNQTGALLGVAPDGKTLVMEYQNQIYGQSLVGAKAPFRVYADGMLASSALSPDGKYMLTAEGVNGVKFREAKNGKILDGLWPTGDLPAEQVAFSADGSKFVVLCARTSASDVWGGNPPFKDQPGAKGVAQFVGQERQEVVLAAVLLPQLLLAGPQPLLHQLAVVDVDVDPDHAERRAVRGVHEPRLAGQPPPLAVRADGAELVLGVLRPLVHPPPHQPLDGGRVGRLDPLRPGVEGALERAAGDPVQVFQFGRPDDAALGDEPVEHAAAAGRLGERQPRARLAGGLLGGPPLGPHPGLDDRPLDRRDQPLQPALEQVIDRAELERLDGHLLAEHPRRRTGTGRPAGARGRVAAPPGRRCPAGGNPTGSPGTRGRRSGGRRTRRGRGRGPVRPAARARSAAPAVRRRGRCPPGTGWRRSCVPLVAAGRVAVAVAPGLEAARRRLVQHRPEHAPAPAPRS